MGRLVITPHPSLGTPGQRPRASPDPEMVQHCVWFPDTGLLYWAMRTNPVAHMEVADEQRLSSPTALSHTKSSLK